MDGSAPPSLTYEYDDEYQTGERPQVKAESPDTVFVSELAAFSAAGMSASPTSADPLFTGPSAPPEDLSFEPAAAPDPEEPGPMWKQEVASRLESYRARRGSRRPRYNATMSLDFDRAANRMISSALEKEAAWEEEPTGAIATVDPLPEPANEFFGATHDVAEPESPPAREQVPVTKILEFPRLATLFDMAPTGNELAEPVVDKPRILYVPEEVPTAQAPLADIQVAPEERPLLPDFEFPLLVAPMGQRVFAALIDALIVLGAAGIFMAVILREVPAPDSKLGYMLVAALPAVFWAIYEYLFLVHCAATPGMQVAHLTLASFDSEPIGRRLRRARALAWMLSTFPLGLGLIWALLDEDTLCWHDRITRTYLVAPLPEYEE